MDDLEKPLPVVIVEAIAWMYVMLSALLFVCAIVNACRDGGESLSGILFVFLYGLCLMSVPVGMAILLRRGRRLWFLVPNTIVMTLCFLGAITPCGDSVATVTFGLVALLLVIVPIVLLHLPSSSRWFNELSGDDAPDRCGCAIMVVVGVLWLGFVGPCLSDAYFSKTRMQNALSHAMAIRGRGLHSYICLNNHSRESGKDWVDASSCSNSTQFVSALWAKFGEDKGQCPYADVWCVAVNPPSDDQFPIFVTANIDPRELLRPQGEKQPLKLTCPKEWGGTCFRFCENAAVVVNGGGLARVVKSKYACPEFFFFNGIPKPGPDTYFLTPTGRVDFVERHTQPGTDPAEPL